MKKIIIIILLSLQFISCSNNKDIETYIDYIDNFETAKHIIYLKNSDLLNDVIFMYKDYPAKMQRFYNESLTIDSLSKNLYGKIDFIKNDICKNEDDITIAIRKIKDKNYTLSKIKVEQLKLEFDKMQTVFTKIKKRKDKKKYLNFKTEKWKNIAGLSGKSCNSVELVAVLTKLQYDIINMETDMLNYILSLINGPCDWFRKYEVVVAPLSKTIYEGDSLKVKIFTSIIDTTKEFLVKIGKKSYNMKEGVFKYKKLIKSNTLGKITEKGKVLYLNLIGDTIILPFNINYEVVK